MLTGVKVTTILGENISFHLAHRDSSNTTSFADRHAGGADTSQLDELLAGCNQSFKQRDSAGIDTFTGNFPCLEPRHVSTGLQHVVTIPTRNWRKCHCVRGASFLYVGADFLNIFLIALLAVGQLSGTHFVNTKGKSMSEMLSNVILGMLKVSGDPCWFRRQSWKPNITTGAGWHMKRQTMAEPQNVAIHTVVYRLVFVPRSNI